MASNGSWAKARLPKGITDHQTQSRYKRYIGKFRNHKTARATKRQYKMAAYKESQQEEVREIRKQTAIVRCVRCTRGLAQSKHFYSKVESFRIQLNAFGRVDVETEREGEREEEREHLKWYLWLHQSLHCMSIYTEWSWGGRSAVSQETRSPQTSQREHQMTLKGIVVFKTIFSYIGTSTCKATNSSGVHP